MHESQLRYDPEEMIEALAAFMHLPVAPEDRGEVRAHLVVARRMAAEILEYRMDDDFEPAPVFRA